MSRRVPTGFRTWPATLPAPYYGPYRAVVENVVDGDTVDAMLDVGAQDYPYRTLRLLAQVDGALLGVNAPEKNRAETKAAGLAAMAWTVEQVPPGAQVLVQTETDPDSFGRLLACIRLADGRDLGASLVAAGHGVYQSYRITRPTGRPIALTPQERFTQAQFALARAHTELVEHLRNTGGRQ